MNAGRRLPGWVHFLTGVLTVSWLAACAPLPDRNWSKNMLVASGGQFYAPVASMRQTRFQGVVHQQRDYSCGAAAIATLLTYHYDDPVPEVRVMADMLRSAQSDPALKKKIQREGFSMLDMRRYLENRGYLADGFHLTLDQIEDIGVPAIVLIEVNKYKHFVVLKGSYENRVLLGDPSLGLKSVPKESFVKTWSGPALVIRSKASVGRTAFNQKNEWHKRLPPIDDALSRESLGQFFVNIPPSLPIDDI